MTIFQIPIKVIIRKNPSTYTYNNFPFSALLLAK